LLALVTTVGAWAANARAQVAERAEGPVDPDAEGPQPKVRTDSSWTATEDVPRVSEGDAVWKSRIVMPSDFGSWARAPSPLGLTPVTMTGGEWAVSSRLSFVAEGARNAFDLSFSGANAGLRLHLLPSESPLQMSASGGVTRIDGVLLPSSRAFVGMTTAWSQLQISHDAGPWHISAALRAAAAVSVPGMAPTFMGSVGVARELGPTRVGVEYAFENGTESRSAVMPWIALVRLSRSAMVRLGAAIPVTGGGSVMATLSVAGQF
jgi:hypothetical protein